MFSPACRKGAFAKGRFLAFDVLRGEAPFVLSRLLGGFVLSPTQELLTKIPRRRKSAKNTLGHKDPLASLDFPSVSNAVCLPDRVTQLGRCLLFWFLSG